jgi:hypothetical protein
LVFIAVILAALGTGLMFAARTGPEEATSNIAKWVDWMGISPPRWLTERSADRWASRTAVLLFIAGGIIFCAWIYARAQSPTPPVNQGPCSAYSYGQQGGTTQGCVITPKPESRHLSQGEAEKIKAELHEQRIPIAVIGIGGEEPIRFAAEIAVALQSATQDVISGSIQSATPAYYGLRILLSSPLDARRALHKALTAAGLSVEESDGIFPMPATVQAQFAGRTVLIVGLHPELQMR